MRGYWNFFRREAGGQKFLRSGDGQVFRVPLPKDIAVMKCNIWLKFK